MIKYKPELDLSKVYSNSVNDDESSILTFARDLYMVATFLGVAYLVIINI